jgi:hypothetical protein
MKKFQISQDKLLINSRRSRLYKKDALPWKPEVHNKKSSRCCNIEHFFHKRNKDLQTPQGKYETPGQERMFRNRNCFPKKLMNNGTEQVKTAFSLAKQLKEVRHHIDKVPLM